MILHQSLDWQSSNVFGETTAGMVLVFIFQVLYWAAAFVIDSFRMHVSNFTKRIIKVMA